MNCSIPGCENPCEGTLWICATHNAEKRKAERDARKIKVIKPIKKVTEKKAKELIKYSKLRADFLEFKMVCEIKLQGCTISATTVHHTAGRLGDHLLDTKTWKAACLSCHDKLHSVLSAKENRDLGFKI